MSENRLINEKSPYLLQHAHNPVDWYPWGEEAFEKAKEEDKPIFLSVGYSTCHWCHNMARESFENEEIAGILNKYFVSIKVDREERYDIDNLYMKFCQATSGRGGWPMSIFMTPEGKPFFAGTYFPRIDFRGITGFKTVLLSLKKLWKNDREKIEETAEDIVDFVKKNYMKNNEKVLTEDSIKKSAEGIKKLFDSEYGGFGPKPKFPMAHNITFLLEYSEKYDDEIAKAMALKTLDSIFKGGIYDHAGSGFSRYSVDEKWMVPHFEKMLYDNALLLEAYTEAYRKTENPLYEKIVRDTIGFLGREMKDYRGGFYAGIDADSEGDEGKYYLWTESEISFILGKENFERFSKYFNLEKSSLLKGRIVLNRIGREVDIADYDFLEKQLLTLLQHRENRIKPHIDEKIMCAWNSMLAKSLFKAGKVFEEQEFIDTGKKILEFIEKNMVLDGRIMTAYIDGEVKYKGFIQDYAFYIDALKEEMKISEDKEEKERLTEKIDFYTEEMLRLFKDEKGGFYLAGDDADELIMRAKETTDGSVGSGNSAAARVLIELSQMKENFAGKSQEELREIGKRSLDISGQDIEVLGIYYGEALRGLLRHCK